MADFNAIANGDWHVGSTWSTGTIPSSADNVYLGGFTVTVADTTSAECLNLVMHGYGAPSTLGKLVLAASTSTLTIGSQIVVGSTGSTATLGAISIIGTCTAANISFAGGINFLNTTLTYGLFQRDGSFTKCVITITGNIIMPSVSISSWVVIYAKNTHPTQYDEWIVNGNITFPTVTNYGAQRYFINGDTCLAMHLTINGNIVFVPATNGGTAGSFHGTTGNSYEMRLIINGNVTSGGFSGGSTGYVYCIRCSGVTTNAYGLGKYAEVNGNIIGVGDFTAAVYVDTGGTFVHTTGNVYVTSTTYRAIDIFTGAVATVNRIIPPATSTGTVIVDDSFTGTLTVNEIDCRTQATNTTNKLLTIGALTVPRDITIGKIYVGACISTTVSSNVANRLLIDHLYGSDYGSVPTVASQPAMNILSTPNVKAVINNMYMGNWGSWPIAGWWQLKDLNSKIYARDAANSVVEMGVVGTAIIPLEADVRSGVAVGYGTGTLTVPQVANVQSGVVFDNGSVGTLAGLTSADLVPIAKEATLAAVKAKTDQLGFIAGAVVANAGINYDTRFNNIDDVITAIQTDTTSIKTTTTATGVAVSGIKSQTDQLVFLPEGVKATTGVTGGETTLTAELTELDSILTGIKTKTDALAFTTGVNATSIIP